MGGGKVSSINTKIDKSISFTDKEADMIDDKVGLGVFSSSISLSSYKEIKVNGISMFKSTIIGSITMSDGSLKKVDLKIPISCYSYKNEKGKPVPNNIWKSDNYRKAEKKLKK